MKFIMTEGNKPNVLFIMIISPDAIVSDTSRLGRIFTILEETLIEGKRCLKVFLLVAETFTE